MVRRFGYRLKGFARDVATIQLWQSAATGPMMDWSESLIFSIS
jgi:hypothetical protein